MAYTIPTDIAQISHYRNEPKRSDLKQKILDTTIWKLKDELISEVDKTLKATKFQPWDSQIMIDSATIVVAIID